MLYTLDAVVQPAACEEFGADKLTIAKWMDAWMGAQKRASNTLYIGRFADPIYFLTHPIKWTPDPGQDDVQAVTVPVGFVTDFASIPRMFWSALRPDGNYAWAAVVRSALATRICCCL
jgi:hypothetical protein